MSSFNVVQIIPSLESGGAERGTIDVSNYLSELEINNNIISNGGRLLNETNKDFTNHFKLAVDSKKFSNLTMKFSIYPPTSSVVFIRDYENKGNAAVLALLNNFQEQEELAPIVSATRDENADLLTFFYNDFKSIWNC